MVRERLLADQLVLRRVVGFFRPLYASIYEHNKSINTLLVVEAHVPQSSDMLQQGPCHETCFRRERLAVERSAERSADPRCDLFSSCRRPWVLGALGSLDLLCTGCCYSISASALNVRLRLGIQVNTGVDPIYLLLL